MVHSRNDGVLVNDRVMLKFTFYTIQEEYCKQIMI